MRILLLCIMAVISLVYTQIAHAETMLSPSYQIRFGNFNMTSGLKSSTSYSLTDTVGQTAAELFSSDGYSVKAGFQYIYTLYEFAFSISDLTIDFGSLIPNTFSTATNNLIVTAPGQGYSVQAYEEHRLKTNNNDYIDDTTCNSGCSESSAGVWTSTAATGFGYNLTGHDIAADFTNSTYFRPFPDVSLGDSPAIVMTTPYAGRDRTATVTYQVNVDNAQAQGSYETEIVYIATPVY